MDEKIRAVFEALFDLNGIPFTHELSMEDVEAWDSLSHLELVTKLEEAFGIRFSPEAIVELTSIAKIRGIIADYAEVS